MKLSDIKSETLVQLDDGFDCQPAGRVKIHSDAFNHPSDLYFHCSHGKHYLSRCIRPDGTLIGISPVPKLKSAVNDLRITRELHEAFQNLSERLKKELPNVRQPKLVQEAIDGLVDLHSDTIGTLNQLALNDLETDLEPKEILDAKDRDAHLQKVL